MSAPAQSRPVPTGSASWDTSWTQALTALELDVAAVEEMLTTLHEEADVEVAVRPLAQLPLAQLGPIPMDQVERARLLLARQQEAAAALSAAMTTNRRQQRLATSLHQRAARAPIYIDTAL